jgi:dTDP-4-amino-4,6-dideoxygalactose transaminase
MKIPPARVYFPDEDRQEILQKIDECLLTGQMTLGKMGKQLEEEFARYTGIRYAVAVNSGTSSIEVPLRILDIKGKEVLVPTNTFFATPAAVIHAGGRVRFLDADPTTFAVSLQEIKRRRTDNTVGVIVVHIAGLVSPEMPAIREYCSQNDVFLFEDAAHAHGCFVEGQMAGTFGIAASFSLYPTKVMTSAEGGIIVTSDKTLYEEALIYRDQGKAGFLTNFHTRLGYNWRMSEPHAIIGLAQFHRLEEFIAARNRVAAIYDAGLAKMPGIHALPLPQGCRSNYYKHIALLEPGVDRKALKKLLKEQYEVSLSGEVYEVPCHLQPVFAEWKEGEFPVAEDICRRHICVPVYATMTSAEAEYVLDSLADALHKI